MLRVTSMMVIVALGAASPSATRAQAPAGEPESPAVAGGADLEPRPPYELQNTGALFLTLETVGALGLFVALSTAAGNGATECGWCTANAFDGGVRDLFLASNSRQAATWSHVFSIGVAPAVSFAGVIVPGILAQEGWFIGQDLWMILNSFILATAFSDMTKTLADRRRPGFHHGRAHRTEAGDIPEEEFLSFFSGDTAWAFSLTASASTLAFLRGYEIAPYLAAVGGAVSATAGVLRISADMHWATDVLAGAFVGTACGVLPALVMHRRETTPDAVALVPSVSRERAMLLVHGAF